MNEAALGELGHHDVDRPEGMRHTVVAGAFSSHAEAGAG